MKHLKHSVQWHAKANKNINMNAFFFYLRAEIFVFMVVPFNEVAVLPGGDHALSLDAMTTWTPCNVTTHVSIYFGGYIGHRFSSVFTILQKKGNSAFNKNEIQ